MEKGRVRLFCFTNRKKVWIEKGQKERDPCAKMTAVYAGRKVWIEKRQEERGPCVKKIESLVKYFKKWNSAKQRSSGSFLFRRMDIVFRRAEKKD